MYTFQDENPTKMYLDALETLLEEGEECCPRGKLIKELRPTSVEFKNPYNRVTFLGSRRVNPFFQLAESLWILSGRADVEWLVKYNANMAQFSDDGKYFNAPYGERIRSWNKNSAHGVIINPIDQMFDAYTKLLNDKDTRQAVVLISNPMFDNSNYTIKEHGRDVACNLIFTFKIRRNRLNMTVFNRSNDAHWGLWGANLCQFSTIQEVMCNWLKHSGKSEFANLELGEYCQVTDSLHIYLDEYGAKCTTDVTNYYKEHSKTEVLADFTCVGEPRMSLSFVGFEQFLDTYWSIIDPYLMDDNHLQVPENVVLLEELMLSVYSSGIMDDYWYFAVRGMLVYRLVKLGYLKDAVSVLSKLPSCQWKISMMYFLKSFINKFGRDENNCKDYKEIVQMYSENIFNISKDLVDGNSIDTLRNYLQL